MKIINGSKKETKCLRDVPDGDLFLIGSEMYFKSRYNDIEGATCYMVRDGSRHHLFNNQSVTVIESITYKVEE